MKLIDVDALRDCFHIKEKCDDCPIYDCSARQEYTLQDICVMIDEVDVIDAIPVDFIKYRMYFAQENGFNEAYEAFAFVLRAWKTTGKLWEQEAR